MTQRDRTVRTLAAMALLASPLSAQVESVTLQGRVIDAVSIEGIAGAVVGVVGTVVTQVTDATGAFTLTVEVAGPIVLVAEQFGYQTARFELPPGADQQPIILTLEPSPLELPEIRVVGEQALDQVIRRMETRRTAFAGAVRAFDRERILKLGPGTAMDLVRRTLPFTFPCADDSMELCRRSRGREGQMTICIDEYRAVGGIIELEGLPIEEIFLVEFFGETPRWGSGVPVVSGQVRVYTRWWMLRKTVETNRVLMDPTFGC